MKLLLSLIGIASCLCIVACAREANPDFRQHVQTVTTQNPLQEQTLIQCLDSAKFFFGQNDLAVALLHHKLGVFYFGAIDSFTNLADPNRSKRMEQSYAHYDTAYQIRRKKLGKTDYTTCQTLSNQAAIYIQYGIDITKADSLLGEAFYVKDVQAEPAFIGELWYKRGLCADALNDFKGAQEFFKKALTIFETVQQEKGIWSDNYLAANTAYIQVCNDLETPTVSAFTVYEKAIKNWYSMPNKADFLIDVTMLHFGHALTWRQQGNYTECLTQLQAVRDSFVNNQDMIQVSNIDIEMAKTQCLQKDFKAALKSAQQAYQGLKQLNYPDTNPRMVEILTVLGRVYEGLGDVPTAKKHYERALGDIQNRVNQLFKIEAACLLADLLKKQKQLEASFKSYQLADQLIRMAQGSFKTDWAKTKLAETTASVYENALEVADACFKQTKNRQYLEGATTFMGAQKSILLSESWERAHHLGQMGVPKTDLNHGKSLEVQLKKRQKDVMNLESGAEDALKKTQKTYDDYLALLKIKYPNYLSTRYIKTPPPSPTEIYKALPHKTACIEYFWGQKKLYTMVYAGKQQQLFATEWTPNLKKAIRNYQKTIQIEADTSVFDTTSARLLSQVLVAPALQFVQNQSIPIQSLVFIPDDTLSYLSFDAFHQENTHPNKMGAQTHILLEDFAISKELSTRVLLANQANGIQTSDISMAGFGENYSEAAQQAPNGTDKINKPIQVEVPLKELTKQFLQGQFYQLSQQTKPFIFAKIQQVQLAILAGHGLSDLSNPYKSGIVHDRKMQQPENNLTSVDFYGADFRRTQLLILVACQMQLGQFLHGEGVLSVGRSVSYAGAPRFISSLWNIPDDASMYIITAFCKNINQKMPCNEALRQAKLTYLATHHRKEAKYPCKWAGLELVGNPSALKK